MKEKLIELMLQCRKGCWNGTCIECKYGGQHTSCLETMIADKLIDMGVIIPKWLYRLESRSPDNGLWYDSNNNFVWGIGKLPECKTKDLPMEYDARYHADGRNWHSSCSNKEDLMHWYSLEDALNLIANGFVFTKYLATEYTEYEKETVFIKETCIKRVEMDIQELFESEEV